MNNNRQAEQKKVLIVGGAGYLGSNLAVELLVRNYGVVILDDFSNSSKNVVKTIEKISGRRPEVCVNDIKNKSDLKCILKWNRVDIVFYALGVNQRSKMVGVSDHDVFGMNTLLGVMKESNIFNIIFPSFKKIGKTREANQVNDFFYQSEFFLKILNKDPRWKLLVTRTPEVFGAHVSGMLGKDPRFHDTTFFRELLKKKPLSLAYQSYCKKILDNQLMPINEWALFQIKAIENVASKSQKTVAFWNNENVNTNNKKYLVDVIKSEIKWIEKNPLGYI